MIVIMKTTTDYFSNKPFVISLILLRNCFKLIFIVFSISLFYSCGSLTSIEYNSRIKAVNRINNQSKLLNIALEDIDWRVRNAAFDRLNNSSLTEICNLTKDQAVVIAAKIRLQQTTWGAEFSKSSNSGSYLGNVIGAAALVNSPQPSSYEVVSACHKYIRQGDSSRIPELTNLLNRFGDKTLAEDYINCGNYELKNVGESWGRAHGYNIRTGPGSHRVSWGQNK